MAKHPTKTKGAVRSIPTATSPHASHKAPKVAASMRGPVRTSQKATRTPGVGGPSGRTAQKGGSTRGIRSSGRHDIKL